MRNRDHRVGLALATSAIACVTVAKAGETVTYNYDSLGRLIRVERSVAGNNRISTQYSYDSTDNRVNVTIGAAPVVAGGSFETPEIGDGFEYRPPGSPAAFAGNAGVAGNGSVWGFASAPEGDQAAFVQSAGVASTIWLSVSGLTPGAAYTISFRIAARPGHGANPVTVAYNGFALSTFTPGSTAFTAVTSDAFTASAASGTITFTGSASAADLGTGLDLVTVGPAGSN